MKKLGIIQPGKIGDIIICLPIAKWYFDRGWSVIWPIHVDLIKNFIGYVDYVQFIPLNNFDCIAAHQICFQNDCNRVIDLAFTIPGANSYNSDWYLNHNDTLSFDEMKYAIAEVPFEEKWNLSIKRHKASEDSLYYAKMIKGSYPLESEWGHIIRQTSSSDTVKDYAWPFDKDITINISNDTGSVFDWLKLLETAKGHVLIESCFSNLLDQLQIKVPKQILLLKHGYYGATLQDGHLKGIPRLKLDWKHI